jgi:hypothetical protein
VRAVRIHPEKAMIPIVSEGDPTSFVLGAIAILMTLVLAWRGYRFTRRDDEERKKAQRRRTGE